MANDFTANEMNTNTQNPADVQQAVDAALKEQKKKKKKKRLILFIVIVVLLIIIIAAASSGGSSSTAVKVDGGASNTSDTAESEKAAQTSFVKGDVVETSDLRISFTDCNANYTDYSTYSGPSDGYKVVRAAFTFENISSRDQILDDFDCYADDVACNAYYYADDYSSPVLETISAGKKFNAVVYYEVPEDAKNIILEYETDYWSSDKIEFVIQ